MKTKTTLSFEKLPKTYEGLCQVYLPRPIHDQVGLKNTTEIIDLMAGHDLNEEQEDYLAILSDLVADYEEANDPVAVKKLPPLEALRLLMEESGMNGSGLSKLLGVDRTLGNKILRGERQLTAEHIKKLSAHFHMEAGCFL